MLARGTGQPPPYSCMLMRPIAPAAPAEMLSSAPDRGIATPLVFLVAAVGIAGWIGASVALIEGFGVWASSTTHMLHLALCAGCMTLASAYATRVHGGLDYKLSQALLATFLIFGVYALAILGGRLYFSRPMMTSALLGGAVISSSVVLLRHQLSHARVAVISPLIGEPSPSLPFARIIRDPTADLRGFDVVLVSLSKTVSAEWARALSRAMLAGCKVRHIGEYVEELKGAVSLEHFEVDHLPPNGIASYQLVKRLMDVGLVVFILPVALPLVALSALAILIAMGRPIFFVQERVGLGGEPFRMWKLRTMRQRRPGEAQNATVAGDARITPLGGVLRRFRIDELPQLWNVLKGDMSLIGPRPEQPNLTADYIRELPVFAYRHLVRPGITGWAQVRAGYAATLEETRTKLQYDLFYVKRLSLYLDLQIAFRTLWTLAAGAGVR